MFTKRLPAKIALMLFLFLFIVAFSPLMFGKRALTENENTLLDSVYGSSVQLDKIRIKSGGPLTLVYPGVTIMNTISFPNGEYDEFDKKDQALLVHEACHVWQYQHYGFGYIPRSVWELVSQSDTYTVHFDENKSLRDYDVEEQCEIMAEYHTNRNPAFEPFIKQLNI